MGKNVDITKPFIIAGPCSAESEDQVMSTARALKECGVTMFRSGLWKPRTRPGCFEGVGTEGLPWLIRVQKELGMKVCTEVASASHVKAVAEAGLDMVWIGARTTGNPFIVQEIAEALAGTGIPVLVKNPLSPDIELWAGAIERFLRQGVTQLGVVHRGFSTFETIRYRNTPQWHVAVGMRSRFPDLLFLCDPSHMAGKREFVPELAQKAMDLGLDGLMVESHICPDCALSDSDQQLTPVELGQMLSTLIVRSSDTDDASYRNALDELRARIDIIDKDLVELLSERMEVSREIGRIKKESNIAIIQAPRWEEVMTGVLSDAKARGMDLRSIRAIFDRIHDASVSEQNKIIEHHDSKI